MCLNINICILKEHNISCCTIVLKMSYFTVYDPISLLAVCHTLEHAGYICHVINYANTGHVMNAW